MFVNYIVQLYFKQLKIKFISAMTCFTLGVK